MSDIPYSVRGSVTSVNRLRGLNFGTIEDNEIFKKVDANNVGGTKLTSTATVDSNVLRMFADIGPFEVLCGYIEAQSTGGVQKLHLNNTGDKEDGITITSNKRVGIGTFNPGEKLEVRGAIKIDSVGVARLKFNNTTVGNIADLDAIVDGTGGAFGIRTKVNGGSLTEKLRINNIGAIGIGGANYGTAGQVLVSNDSGSSVSWANQTDTTYSNGTGVNLVGTTFSIGQPVAISDSPSFNSITAQTFGPSYVTIPSLAGKIGQTVYAVDTPVNLVYNAEIQVLSLTIPYTGVWLIGMSLYLGNIGSLAGQILFPTSIFINGSITHNFYGTNITGVNGTITRNLSVNDVVTFRTYLTGSGASGLSASERGVWFGAFTFLTATRIA